MGQGRPEACFKDLLLGGKEMKIRRISSHLPPQMDTEVIQSQVVLV